MLYIRNDSLDPYYNLALEEYLIKSAKIEDNCVLLWQNSPSVIIGRFQNTIEEINVDYIRENNIYVVRRLTGGGAVYHDLGNLNFSFLEKDEKAEIDFHKYIERIAKALAQMGIKTEVSGRNDITIEGKKFSGNAQFHFRGKTLHHGTILYNSDLENIEKTLNVRTDKIQSKGIKSVRSRVTNIIDYMENKLSLQEFKELLLHYLFEGKPIREYEMTPKETARVKELMAGKYLTWEWNYGNSPTFNVRNKARFKGGQAEIGMQVKQGVIKACKIYGDFFSNEGISALEEKFVGIRFEKQAIRSVLEAVDVQNYLGTIEKEEFIGMVLNCFRMRSV